MNNKISASQLFCMLLLSRLSAEIVYPQSTISGRSGVTAITALLLAELIRFALALPVIVYAFRGENPQLAVWRKNRFFGWVWALLAALLLTAASLRILFNSSVFAVKNLIIGGAMWAVFTVSAIFAIYAAAMGTEAVARAGAIILIAAALVTVTAMLADIPYMKLPNAASAAEAVSETGLPAFLNEIFERLLRGGDYLIFAALLPYVERRTSASAGKCALYFALFSTLSSLLICVVNLLVLREIYGLAEYPFIAAASLSDIAFFKRLDGAAAAVWMLCAVFRAGALLLSAERVIAQVAAAGRRRTNEGETF